MSYSTHTIKVDGGNLHFGMWGMKGPVILCSHGLTANHTCWNALAAIIGDKVRLIAPDHRGRGKSNGIEGPWGMETHAQDMIAIMDHLNIEQADMMIGHSMGGFVAAVAGANHPKRIKQLLFIDGGLPSIDKMPENVSAEQLVLAVVGPSMQRLDMQFESRAAYHDFWKQHPCFANDWSEHVEAYIDYDLVGTEPALHSGVLKQAILRDVETQLMSDLVANSLLALKLPVHFVKAEYGMTNADPLYADDAIDDWAGKISHFTRATIADVNHFTIVIGEHGAKATANEILTLTASR